MEMPLAGSTSPCPARWTGEMLRSAAFTSHTYLVSNQTSGTSVSPYLYYRMCVLTVHAHRALLLWARVVPDWEMHSLQW